MDTEALANAVAHALVTQRFNLLAEFNPQKSSCLFDARVTQTCKDQLKNKINKIMRFHYTEINGFL
jgi:hypothetical protein